MKLHQVASSVLGVVPRSPGELRQQFGHALGVLAQEPQMLRACVALVLAGVCLALSRRPRTTLISLLAVAVTSAIWLQASQVREGTILVGFSAEHGLTEADLLVPAVVSVAGALWLLGQVLRRRRGGRRHPEVRSLQTAV